MKIKDKVQFITEKLEELYPETPIPLVHKDNYTLLVAVLLSAQCTDERVNRITPHLFELADTPETMAVQDALTIEKIIKPCGLSPKNQKQLRHYQKLLWKSTMDRCRIHLKI